jgi:hypothetical protein
VIEYLVLPSGPAKILYNGVARREGKGEINEIENLDTGCIVG